MQRLRRTMLWAAGSILALIVVISYLHAWNCGAGATFVRAAYDAVIDSHILPSGAKIEYSPGLWESAIYVHGVMDAPTQDDIIRAIQDARGPSVVRPWRIEFKGPAEDDRLLRTEFIK